MNRFQSVVADGDAIRVRRAGRPEEIHRFATCDEALARAAIIEEALSWIGTPFINCADIKGPKGGIDCAMLAVRCYVDTGRLMPFDPRPYPPAWMMHHSEERFLNWIRDNLGAREVERPRIGDVPVWQFGRCFSHCGIVINSTEVVHAFKHAGMVIISRLNEQVLTRIAANLPRPVKYFDVWGS